MKVLDNSNDFLPPFKCYIMLVLLVSKNTCIRSRYIFQVLP